MINKLQKLAISSTAAISALLTGAALARGYNFGTISPGEGYSTSFGGMISSVLQIVMVVALLLVLLYLILGGIEWITSGGDKGKTESARNKITSAIIGIIILAASYALVQFVAFLLGFASFQDAFTNLTPIDGTK